MESFCETLLSENSVLLNGLRGHFIREQHSAIFTRYIGAYFIGKYAMQVLIVPLGEVDEAQVVSGSAAKGTDFLDSMVSKLSKVHFDLPFLDLN